jgi:S1-C subfamily serine protease
MNRLAALALACFVIVPRLSTIALARVMGGGDATVVQTATPAVVNVALWKLRPPAKTGDPPRRVKVYGSGFVIDPSGIIVTNRHVIDGAIRIAVIFDNGDDREVISRTGRISATVSREPPIAAPKHRV